MLLLAFVSILFAMGTVNLACNTRMTQLEFIDNRNFPGGPNAWFFEFYSDGVNTAGNAAYVIANVLTDGLLVSTTSLDVLIVIDHDILASCGVSTPSGTRCGSSPSLASSLRVLQVNI